MTALLKESQLYNSSGCRNAHKLIFLNKRQDHNFSDMALVLNNFHKLLSIGYVTIISNKSDILLLLFFYINVPQWLSKFNTILRRDQEI